MTRPPEQKWEIVRPPLASRFHLPNKEDLFRVTSGDYVKLIFMAEDDIERMWVNVNQCGDSMKWTGLLANDPVQEHISSVLKYGDPVTFHPYDVVGIETDRESINTSDIEQIIDTKLSQVRNTSPVKWYKNPHIIVPAIISILGIIATISVALIAG